MITRRQFIYLSAVSAGGGLFTQGCFFGGAKAGYEEAVGNIWRHTENGIADKAALMRELVRYATLAPSSHNSQCWKFRVQERAISILPDLSRRIPVVDPDDHHLFVSLGCAAENMVQAAMANGLKGEVSFEATPKDTVQISLNPTKTVETPLSKAITKRQCTRAEYDGKPLSNEELQLLEQSGKGNGVQVLLFTDKQAMENVLDYVVQGNIAQMRDPAFVEELKEWLRFSDAEAVRFGDGLFSRCSGSPAAPRWLGNIMFSLFFKEKAENEKYTKQIRSSAGIAVFVSDVNDKAHWIETGRCYDRFALQAAALGIRNAHLNQPVEVSALRPQFASMLGIGDKRPDLVIRFGRGTEMPRSLRRPIEDVLLT